MKRLIRKLLQEQFDKNIEVSKPKSNLDKVIDKFKKDLPDELKPKLNQVGKFISDYIIKNNINVKFLNSCSVGFSGVRTKDQVIICSPMNMSKIGDFIYTIFHEIRHEQQIRDIKMLNPLTDFDLDDFEALSKEYWDMELDADQFAKNMVAKIVIKLNIPIDMAKDIFSLSAHIELYPSMSRMVISQLSQIINGIKTIKKTGAKYEDIQDHPFVKSHIDKLEKFI